MKIEHIVNQVRPNRIYTHNIDDIHQDHRNVAKATISASRKSSGILCYETPKSTVFSPQYFVDISDVIDVKTEAIRCFVSQSNKEYMKINAIKGLASYRGYIVGVKYAEAFSVVRLFDNLL
jgi:LmbE family N-acetylglucosaminyl deacetylase